MGSLQPYFMQVSRCKFTKIYVYIVYPNQSYNQSNWLTLRGANNYHYLQTANGAVVGSEQPTFTSQSLLYSQLSHYSQCFTLGSLLPESYGAQ